MRVDTRVVVQGVRQPPAVDIAACSPLFHLLKLGQHAAHVLGVRKHHGQAVRPPSRLRVQQADARAHVGHRRLDVWHLQADVVAAGGGEGKQG